jgi:LysR family transcriptional regulator, regulator for bpeEF and oprC
MLVRNILVRMKYQSPHALDEMAAFVAVVESNGFSAAARVSGARKATLSLRIARLEARLGASLLVRTTRSIRLTDEGRGYFEHAQRALSAARDAEAVVASAKAKPGGVLRVTAPTSLADLLFDRVIVPYMTRYPDVVVHFDSSARRIDFARERFDVAIRLGPLEDSELVSRRLGATSGGYFCSPRYRDRHGVPARPADLAAHDTIAVAREGTSITWPFLVRGRRRSVVVRPRLSVSSHELGARAAAAGLGVLRAPTPPVRPFLVRKQLVRVLAEWSPPNADVFAVTPRGGPSVPKTRAFLDMLVRWYETEADRVAVKR